MPCLLALLALAVPRLVIVVLFVFTDYLGRAYEGWLLPLLGFVFLPVTTLAYAWAVNSAGGVKGPFWIAVMVIAVLIDLGSAGESERRRRRR